MSASWGTGGVEQFVDRVRAQPGLDRGEVFRVRRAIGAPGPGGPARYPRSGEAVELLDAGPALGRGDDDHRPLRPVAPTDARVGIALNRPDLGVWAAVERVCERGVEIVAADEQGPPPVALEQLAQLLRRSSFRARTDSRSCSRCGASNGSTAPSVAGLRNFVECHAVAVGPVSNSPSPTMHATMRSGLSTRHRTTSPRRSRVPRPRGSRPGATGSIVGKPPGHEKVRTKRASPSRSRARSG